MEATWVPAVTVPTEAEAQLALDRLVRAGIGGRVERDFSDLGYAVLVREGSMGDAIYILRAADDPSGEDPLAEEPDPLSCPRCGSQGVDVGPPGAMSVFFLQQVLGVPYLRKPCTCMSCGQQWRQYVESI